MGGGVLQISPGHPILGLSVVFQVPYRQVRVSIRAAGSLAEPVPVIFSLPRHPDSIGLLRVTLKRVSWMVGHAHLLGHINVEVHSVKQLRQVFKLPLKLG